jgi:hypothetical protein
MLAWGLVGPWFKSYFGQRRIDQFLSFVQSCGMDKIFDPNEYYFRSGHFFLIMAGSDVDEMEHSLVLSNI